MVQRPRTLAALVLAAACSSSASTAPSGEMADASPIEDSGTSSGQGGGLPSGDAMGPPSDSKEAGESVDAPFERPNTDASYLPERGTCGFDAPAFCDTFENGPMAGGRSGELDPARWSATRGGPWDHPNFDVAFGVGPSLLPTCRAGLPTSVLPDSDALICDPTAAVPTRHLLTATAAQNYGLNTYRIRQPFDFAGRTGTIKLDVDLTNNGLGGWPAISISEDPSPAPSFDWEERGSGPRNGVEVEFNGGWCNNPHTLEVGFYSFRDYVQTAMRPSFDCDTPHATTVKDSLNHVEIYLTKGHLEVWASDASPDGRTFPNFHQLYAVDVDLPFDRGYVNLIVRNHATMKYWVGSAWAVRWDNVGFDGPVVGGFREYDVPDSLTVTQGLDGCLVDGVCRWRGEVIPMHPGDDTVCHPQSSCTFDGEGRNVGYVVPNQDEPPVALSIPDVRLDGATRARLAWAATYPWFEWNGVNKPPTAMNLRYRLNGGAWHDRFVTDVEANAFTDFSPDLGGAGHGAGLLNQMIELDPSELHDGTNLLELGGSGTWTGSYRMGVVGVDLVLTTAK